MSVCMFVCEGHRKKTLLEVVETMNVVLILALDAIKKSSSEIDKIRNFDAPPPKKKKKSYIFHSIGATIRIGREIQCPRM